MKNIDYFFLALLLAPFCALGQPTIEPFSQNHVSGQVYTGLLMPYTDFTATDYAGYKPNLAVGAGVGYELIPDLRLRFDLMYGSLNGNNTTAFYETNIIEPQIGAEYNLLSLLNLNSEMFKLNFQLGTGMLFYTARMYDLETGARLSESPVRTQKPLSPNVFACYGANLGIKILPKLDLNLGLANRLVLGADYLDSYPAGDAGDHYGLAHAGFVYYLSDARTPGTVEVEEDRFKDLSSKADSLQTVRRDLMEAKQEVAQMEMVQQEQKLRMREFERKLDSARAVAVADSIPSENVDKPEEEPSAPKTELDEVRYRIIVASLPSREMAQRWIDRSNLATDEMIIIFSEKVDAYRVIYRSFDNFDAAQKEQQNIKKDIPDAWIVKL